MPRAVATIILLLALPSGCASYDPMFRFDTDGQCWVKDRPEGLDISSCERKFDGSDQGTRLTLEDPDGTCWIMPYCGAYVDWEGWDGAGGPNCPLEVYDDTIRFPPCD